MATNDIKMGKIPTGTWLTLENTKQLYLTFRLGTYIPHLRGPHWYGSLLSILSNIVYYPGEGPALLTPSITPKLRPAGPPPPLNHLFEALLKGLLMSPVRISKPVVFCIEEKAMLLSVFYYCICNFLCCCRWPIFVSFLLSCVAVSRPRHLLKCYYTLTYGILLLSTMSGSCASSIGLKNTKHNVLSLPLSFCHPVTTSVK